MSTLRTHHTNIPFQCGLCYIEKSTSRFRCYLFPFFLLTKWLLAIVHVWFAWFRLMKGTKMWQKQIAQASACLNNAIWWLSILYVRVSVCVRVYIYVRGRKRIFTLHNDIRYFDGILPHKWLEIHTCPHIHSNTQFAILKSILDISLQLPYKCLP